MVRVKAKANSFVSLSPAQRNPSVNLQQDTVQATVEESALRTDSSVHQVQRGKQEESRLATAARPSFRHTGSSKQTT